MPLKLSQIPFVRILVPFVSGIVTELYYPSHFLFFYSCLPPLSLLCLWYWIEKKKNPEYSLRWIYGLLVGIFLYTSGYTITLLQTPSESYNYAGNFPIIGKDSLVLTLVSDPQEKLKTYKTTGEIKGFIKNNQIIKTNGKALFYFYKDSISEKLKYGDEIVVYTKLQEIEAPSNPDEFDYKKFLMYHRINYECFVLSGGYTIAANNKLNFLLIFTNNCRRKLSSILHEKLGANEAGIASAILLGYREDLSPAVVQSFVDGGVVHVICVAGLHVGILFLILSYIIIFPENFKYRKQMSIVIILVLLWLYALLTGLATPVLRSTIMFSFLTIGKYYRKYTNSVNILAASAFILLLFDPFSIAESSLQLSYLSVLGILVIYKPLLSLYIPTYIITRKIWELICVSVAAQVAIFPLTLYYFHQFPNYFVFINILVVPLLFLVICIGLFFLFVSWIPYLSAIAAWVLQKCLLLMNIIVTGASHLPFSISKGISISIYEALLLFIVLVFILFFIFYKKYNYLFLGLFASTLFLCFQTIKNIKHARQEIFTVYNVPGKSAISLISGKHSLMPFSKIDSNDINYHLQYNWWNLGVKDNFFIPSDTVAVMLSGTIMIENQFAQINNNKIAFIKQNSDLPSFSDKLNLHFVIISGGYDLDMMSLKNAFTFDTLIFDSSVPDYKLKKWEMECRQLNLHFYSVKTQGAYIEKC